jgi:hypothetical protein
MFSNGTSTEWVVHIAMRIKINERSQMRTMMDRKKISTYATDELTLRVVRQPSITVACLICNRHGAFDRQALIKRHGASLTFHALRRRVAMGCARMHEPDGVDRCGTHFPGITSVGSA